MQNKIKGFSLMELMIVVTIIGILVAIAVPSYQSYTKRAHFTEVVQSALPYKLGVEECYQALNSLDQCQSGQQGIPAAINDQQGKGLIKAIQVTQGIITVTPQDKYGITANDTYILTPDIEDGSLHWQTSGGSVTAGLTK